MNLPVEVEKAIRRGREIINNDPLHHLDPNHRLVIYNSFGSSNQYKNKLSQIWLVMQGEIEQFILTKADYVFGHLAILTAKKVLPLWEKAYPLPADDSPSEMLRTADKVLEGTFDPVQAFEDLSEKFYWRLTNVQYFVNEQVHYAGESANAALEAVLRGLQTRKYRKPLSTNEAQIPHSNSIQDFAALAMAAYSIIDKNPPKGDYLNRDSFIPIEFDAQKRLEFWEWWLKEAIPEAWELAVVTHPSS